MEKSFTAIKPILHVKVVSRAAKPPAELQGLLVGIVETMVLKRGFECRGAALHRYEWRNQLQRAAEHISQAVIGVDVSDRVMYANPAVETCLKLKRSDIIGRRCVTLSCAWHCPTADRSPTR